MAIISEIYDGELPGLTDAMSAALPAIGVVAQEMLFVSAPSLIGPFASYSADPRDFVEVREAEQNGWRGLVLRGDEPMVAVDVFMGGESPPTFGFRGREAADAFAQALRIAQRFEEGDERYTVRWLSLPEIYVTALWLAGPTNLFVATRLGGSDRPKIELINEDGFVARVVELIERSSTFSQGIGDADSPRSGLSLRG